MRIIGISGAAGAGKDTVAAMLASTHIASFLGKSVTVRSPNVHDAGTDPNQPKALVPGARQISLADPIKIIAVGVYDFTFEQCWGTLEQKNAPDFRYPRMVSGHSCPGSSYDAVYGEIDLVCARCGVRVVDPRRPPPGLETRSTATGAVVFWPGDCTTYLSPREALQKIGTELGRTLYTDTWTRLALAQCDALAAAGCPLVVIADVRFDSESRAVRAYTGPGGNGRGEVWRIERPGAGLTGAAGAHASEAGVSDALVDRVLQNDGPLEELRARVVTALEHSDAI